jgi:hypothetical protein
LAAGWLPAGEDFADFLRPPNPFRRGASTKGYAMSVMENAPDVHVHTETEASLTLDRTDISFEDLTEDIVRISVRIHNRGSGRSAPTTVRLESAPLGAFVPWQSLAVLPLPSIEPGESRVVSIDALRPDAVTRAGSGSLPPAQPAAIAAGAAAPDAPQEPARDIGFEIALTKWIQKHRRSPSGLQRPPLQEVAAFAVPQAGELPHEERQRIAAELRRQIIAIRRGPVLAPSPMDAQQRRHFYFAGNINVFVSSRAPVERHMAKALRIYPGVVNAAMFIVGDGRPDAYSFQLKGLSQEWNALLRLGNRMTFIGVSQPGMSIRESEWVESPGQTPVMLHVSPPEGCQTGNVEVHVTRRSCGSTAIVEFNLDPAAQGAGCYHI